MLVEDARRNKKPEEVKPRSRIYKLKNRQQDEALRRRYKMNR